MKRQKGSVSIELILALTLTGLLTVGLLFWASQALANFNQARAIHHHVNDIIEATRTYFAQSVLSSRCLAQSSVSMEALSLSSNDSVASYTVSYLQNSATNTRPTGIEVQVTIADTTIAQGVAGYLAFDRQEGKSWVFDAPLDYQLPDWQELDITTGCIK